MAFDRGVAEHVVDVGGRRIRYYESRPTDDERDVIVLLHGTDGSAERSFWALFPMLATRHRVVALDFVDPEPGSVPRMDDYVEQAVAVAAACDEGRPVHVVGYSWGAVVAARAASMRPELVSTLTLVAGWLKTDAHQRLRNRIWQSLHDDRHPALAAFSVFVSSSQTYINGRTPDELEAAIERVAGGPDRSVKMALNREVDLTATIEGVVAPTLVVGCLQDQMVPIAHARMLLGAIENSRLAEIDSGHGVVHERPSELYTLIDEFVRHPDAHPAGSILAPTHV
jgi:pimeloyl-ACP methyl ester carboxylesterase